MYKLLSFIDHSFEEHRKILKRKGSTINIKLALIFLKVRPFTKTEKPSCYAYGFTNRSSTSSEIPFHGLPRKSKCPSIREQWLANIKSGYERHNEERKKAALKLI